MVTYPKDWNEKTFGQFIKIKRGASPRPIEAFLTPNPSGVNWIKIGDASKGSKYITSTKEKITDKGALHSVPVFPGDFILSNSMSFGRPYILKIDGCIHDGWLRLFDFSNDADDEFLYYLLSSNYVQNQYAAYAAGSGVQNLNKEVVKKVTVYLPSVPEQKKIVETLSSFDECIDNLAELIEKKKNIRNGALRDLLSASTRIENCNGSWREFALKDVLREKIKIGPFGSQLKKETLVKSGDYKVYGQENIYVNDFSVGDRFLKKEHFESLSTCEVKSGDFLMSTMGTIGKCAIVPRSAQRGIMDSHLIRFRIDEKKLLPEYLLQLFSENYNYLSDQTAKLAVGGIMDGLSVGIANQLTIFIPEDINEQRLIVDILTTMDKEIINLEEERNKMIQIRDGAMDDLLTGRIRLGE